MVSQFDLRPRSNGQILDISLRLYRNNFWTFLGIVAIVQVPILIFTLLTLSALFQPFMALMEDPLATPDMTGSVVANIASNLNNVLSAVFVQFANAALSLAVASALFGRKITFRSAYGEVKRRWKSILGTAFLSAVILAAIGIATLILFITILGWMAGYGALIFYSVAIYPIAMPVLMLESESAWQVIGRAWRLVRNHFWRVLWFSIVLSAFILLVQFGVASLFIGLLGAAAVDGAMNESFGTGFWAAAAAGATGTILVSMFLLPIRITAMTMLYFDLRIRDEGLDLYLKAAGDASAEPLALIESAPRQSNTGSLITWNDFFRAFGFGFGVIALIFGIVFALFGLIAAFGAVASF